MLDETINSKIESLAQMLDQHPGFCVLTGAGCSTESGLPAYRDKHGHWKHSKPMQHNDFVSSAEMRKRYWARSMLGWNNFFKAKPSQTHHVITQLQASGYLSQIITQNVDRLHQHSGCQQVMDLHGRLDQVICLDCGRLAARAEFQDQLLHLNPDFKSNKQTLRPDGDVDIGAPVLATFEIPGCQYCAGVMKPNVVFFGGILNPQTVSQSLEAVEQSPGLLVIGSSLMVFSGFRLVKHANQLNKPVIIINQGNN